MISIFLKMCTGVILSTFKSTVSNKPKQITFNFTGYLRENFIKRFAWYLMIPFNRSKITAHWLIIHMLTSLIQNKSDLVLLIQSHSTPLLYVQINLLSGFISQSNRPPYSRGQSTMLLETLSLDIRIWVLLQTSTPASQPVAGYEAKTHPDCYRSKNPHYCIEFSAINRIRLH